MSDPYSDPYVHAYSTPSKPNGNNQKQPYSVFKPQEVVQNGDENLPEFVDLTEDGYKRNNNKNIDQDGDYEPPLLEGK